MEHLTKSDIDQFLSINNVPNGPVVPLCGEVRGARDDFTALLRSGEHADAEVVCQDRTWKVHRRIFGPRSLCFKFHYTTPVLACAIEKVTLSELDPDMVEVALHHLYSPGHRIIPGGTADFLRFYVRLYRTADVLMLDGLRDIVMEALHTYRRVKNKDVQSECLGDLARSRRLWRPAALGSLDVALRNAYAWDVKEVKEVLLSVVYAALLSGVDVDDVLVHVGDTPAFDGDLTRLEDAALQALGGLGPKDFIPYCVTDRVWRV